MKRVTFPGGIYPPHRKEESLSEPLVSVDCPEEVIIPLSQHIGAPCKAIVKKGDRVREGQLIAQSDSFISAVIHSSVSGEVIKIEKKPHPVLGAYSAVVIKTDENYEKQLYETAREEPLEPEDIIARVKEAGVVGMGGAAFPTHVKLSVPEGKSVDTLIVNGAECEPYLTCDHALMKRKASELLEGIKLLDKVLRPENIYIAVEDNKKAAAFSFEELLQKQKGRLKAITRVVLLKAKYPQGGEKQIIKAITGREVPPGGLPLDIGFLVHNIGTVNAIYEAVFFGKPLIERIVTIAGDCVAAPRNCLVRIGTTVRDLVDKRAIELRSSPGKIIFGGPMMGINQTSMDVPVMKGTSGILFMSDKEKMSRQETECIRCAKCVDVCPVNLIPTKIMKTVKHKKWDLTEELNVSDCMECGSCSYACPSRIPLVQYIKEGKFSLSKIARRT